MAYEADKLADRATADRCAQQGFRLTPMIVETLGGWGPAAQGVFKTLARITAERTGISDSVATRQLYEAFGIKLQRANARAIMARVGAASAASRDNTTLAATMRSEAALVLSAAAAPSGWTLVRLAL
jgi:hypothetical protein